MLVSRISRRVLAEHHIALSADYGKSDENNTPGEQRIGIIFGGLNVKRSVEKCANLLGATNAVVVDGHVDTTFTYIKEHLE